MTNAHGIIQIHSAPSALCPHIEWAIGGALGAPVQLSWRPQPAEPGSYCTEYGWSAEPGFAAKVASAMKRWDRVRFEVTEDHTALDDGVRYSYTPSLGLFSATTGSAGDILVHEDRLRTAIAEAGGDGVLLAELLDDLMGAPWDAELESFRHASEGAPVRWLHRVG